MTKYNEEVAAKKKAERLGIRKKKEAEKAEEGKTEEPAPTKKGKEEEKNQDEEYLMSEA